MYAVISRLYRHWRRVRCGQSLVLAGAVAVALVSGPGAPSARAQKKPPPAKPADMTQKVGFAGKEGTVTIEVTIEVKGKRVPRKVTTDVIKPWQPGPGFPPYLKTVDDGKGGKRSETLAELDARFRGERAAASIRKAEQIRDAINKAFKEEFKALGREATVGKRAVEDPNYPPPKVPVVKEPEGSGFWGLVDIPSVARDQTGIDPRTKMPINTPLYTTRNTTGETGNPGDGLQVKPDGGGGSSSGTKGAMGPAGRPGSATGLDAYGGSSLVQFGIEDQYVAEVAPTSGMTEYDVLMALDALLDANGLPASFDPLTNQLILDGVMADGRTLAFGNTDPGLEFATSFAPVGAQQVPEPTVLVMVGTGLAAAAACRRWVRAG